MKLHTTVPPGATVGIIGGGQLGRGLIQVLGPMGYKSLVICEHVDDPGAQIATKSVLTSFTNQKIWERSVHDFATTADVATYEWESVPLQLVRAVEKNCPVYPSSEVLRIGRDRREEKFLADRLGIPTPHTTIIDPALNYPIPRVFTVPAILKTALSGYDGKGQQIVNRRQDIENVLQSWSVLPIERPPYVLQDFLTDLIYEMSVIVVRSSSGDTVVYPPIQNVHRNGILISSRCPGVGIGEEGPLAQEMATRIANHIEVVGVCAIEFFVSESNGRRRLMLNEIAPRTHNSGWGTVEGCKVSQFENQARAILGLPIVVPELIGSGFYMKNLLGNDILRETEFRRDPHASVTVYGKKINGDPTPNRKYGHVVWDLKHAPKRVD